MPTKILVQGLDGTPAQITFADFAGDFSPATATDLRGTPTDVECQIALTGLADGAAVQSDKVDLGEHRAHAYHVRAAFELAATPTDANAIELYWAPSASATAANGNAANVTGSAGAYSGYSSNLAASVRQLHYIGNFICTVQVTGTVQVAEIGLFYPPERYGSLVVKNECAAAFHSDDVECHVVFDPVIVESQ